MIVKVNMQNSARLMHFDMYIHIAFNLFYIFTHVKLLVLLSSVKIHTLYYTIQAFQPHVGN